MALCRLFLTLLIIKGTFSAPSKDFYPTRLDTIRSCTLFAQQTEYKIAKCPAYFFSNELFLDAQKTEKLRDCLNKLKSIIAFVPTVFYEIRNVVNLTAANIDTMSLLQGDVSDFVEAIPELKMFLGPGGSRNEIVTGLQDINSIVALSVSEKESTGGVYDNAFFASLKETLTLNKTDRKFLVLNGWHLSNTPFEIVLTGYYQKMFSGLIVWVERANAHLIAKQDVLKFVSRMSLPVYLDMPGSPQSNQGSPLLLTPILISTSFLLLRTFF